MYVRALRREGGRLGGERRGQSGRRGGGELAPPEQQRGRSGIGARAQGCLCLRLITSRHVVCAALMRTPDQLNGTGPSVSGLSATSERERGPAVAPQDPGPRPLRALKAHKAVDTEQRGPPKHSAPPQGYRPAGEPCVVPVRACVRVHTGEPLCCSCARVRACAHTYLPRTLYTFTLQPADWARSMESQVGEETPRLPLTGTKSQMPAHST
jgi:hypothetical protein